MTNEKKNRETGSGRFARGASGNLAGRPPGSRNRSTMIMEALLAGEGEQLIRKTIELGKKGDINALRLCLDRLLPARKDRPIELSLPPAENVQQLSTALSMVIEAVGAGNLTPSEGEILTNILEVKAKVLASGDIERRLEQLEQAILTGKDARVDQEAVQLKQRLREGRSPQVANPDPVLAEDASPTLEGRIRQVEDCSNLRYQQLRRFEEGQ